MALNLYTFVRPLLFGLDPETAHELTLEALARTQGTALRWAYAQTRVDDPIELAGLTFPNRVGLAAGLDKNARCIDGLEALGFGFIEVGTVTPRGQAGNPKPRMFRLPEAQALINRLGFNNDGLSAFIANVQRSEHYRHHLGDSPSPHSMLLGLNIGKNADTPMARAAEDYLTCMDAVYPYADYITVNISSPNTKNLRQLQSDDVLDALLSVLSERREVLAHRHGKLTPVFLKIAPDLYDVQLDVIAQTLRRYGYDGAGQVNNAWGVVATNTTISRDAVTGMAHANETGGLSGAPVLPISNQVITQLRAALGPAFPIMGVGGIMCAEDAVGKIRAGADVVQIYTGLIYHGPSLIRQAAMMIKKHSGSECISN
jgi:dihydroorotate dehydrogenase